MQLIKNGIKECVNKGDEIVSKATYIPDKQMMYFVAADFYESDYQGKIEYAVNDLLEKAKGKFIILVDCFVAYNEDDYYSEEGYAECSLGSDMKYFSWDCCKAIPSAEAVEMFDDFLYKLSKRNLQVFVISGNHDSAERIAFGGRLMNKSGIHMSPVYDGNIEPINPCRYHGDITKYRICQHNKQTLYTKYFGIDY